MALGLAPSRILRNAHIMGLVENCVIKGEKVKEIAFSNIKIIEFTFVTFSCSPEKFLLTNNEDNRICLLKVSLCKIQFISKQLENYTPKIQSFTSGMHATIYLQHNLYI